MTGGPPAETLCTRCLLTEKTLNIDFDGNGVCNHCRTYEGHGAALRDFGRLGGLLKDRFHEIRGRYDYDAVVGLSGGKDSSYVAYRVVREHGMKALLFTYDNGFLSEHARDNISRVADSLGQDHVWCTPSPELHRAIYRSSVRFFGIPCVGCTFPGFLHAIKLAVERKIPFLVHGRSRAQMFKQLAPGTSDPFLPYLLSNFEPWDAERNRTFAAQTASKLVRGLGWFARQRTLRQERDDLFMPDLQALNTMEHPPEFLAWFLYEPYDEERIKGILQRDLGWRRPPGDDIMGHEDCQVHPAAAWLYRSNYGFPLLQQELSTMIREGDMTREQALDRLRAETYAFDLSAQSMGFLEEMTGFSSRRILRFSRRTSRIMSGVRLGLKLRNALFHRKPVELPILPPPGP